MKTICKIATKQWNIYSYFTEWKNFRGNEYAKINGYWDLKGMGLEAIQ